MKSFLLSVSSSDAHHEGPRIALTKLSDRFLKTIKQRISMFEEMKKKDETLQTMTFSVEENEVLFFYEKRFSDETVERVWEESIVSADDITEVQEVHYSVEDSVKMAETLMEVGAYGVSWVAYQDLRDSTVALETYPISIEQL